MFKQDEMNRPLVFDCPTTNLVVITRVELRSFALEKVMELSFELHCPCGHLHVLPVRSARSFRQLFDEQRSFAR